MANKIKSSLFDEIFKLQSSAPELDVDPEDPIDGFKAKLVDGVDEIEDLGATSLRKQAAVIVDDPKYKGKKTSRKELYSDEEFPENESSGGEEDKSDSEEASDNSGFDDEEDDDNDENIASDDDDDASGDTDGNEMSDADSAMDKEDVEVNIVPQTKSDDREKGKAVSFQLGVWDELIKSRIALQKMVAACNRLPQADTWLDFNQDNNFRTEANNVHSSVRKLMSALLELQASLLTTTQGSSQTNGGTSADSDEEITSESETEENGAPKKLKNGMGSDEEEMNLDVSSQAQQGKKQKRKLTLEEMEDTISKRHKDFQSFRNNTLSKWDEKTRLAHVKIKAKNFAAFEMSVLKQIEQVLANRERLVRRLHQQRSFYRILGQHETSSNVNEGDKDTIEDWDDEQDVELKLKQKSKQELPLNTEIIDDSDFYHVCLRDLIEMKQNEETDPVTASRQWLEIQRLRNKQKRKVDTKASKGRKIRYNVKEKLKNFMTPYDRSVWSDEQNLESKLQTVKDNYTVASSPTSSDPQEMTSSNDLQRRLLDSCV
ncbi:hypothetical protein Btru_006297 [Bulinus truncatus]|nr:hypothetical protein Btru_006297 [Bulinus truncatus]